MKFEDIDSETMRICAEAQEACKASDFETCIRLLGPVLQKYPGIGFAVLLTAWSLRELGRRQECVQFCEEWVKRHPRHELLSAQYFFALAELRRDKEAMTEARRFISLKDSEIYRSVYEELGLVYTPPENKEQ